MMKLWRLFACSLAVLAAGGLSAAEPADFAGDYAWSKAEGEKAALDKAIAGAEGVWWVPNSTVQSRLAKTAIPYDTIKIEIAGDEITFTRNGKNPVKAKVDGPAVSWTREDGETFQVSFKKVDGKLLMSFVAEDGGRENLFSLSADKSELTMAVTLKSSKLKAPVCFSLGYRRQ